MENKSNDIFVRFGLESTFVTGIFRVQEDGSFMLDFLFNNLFSRVLALSFFVVASSNLQAELSDAAKIEFFDKKINPILKQECFKCHGARESEAAAAN